MPEETKTISEKTETVFQGVVRDFEITPRQEGVIKVILEMAYLDGHGAGYDKATNMAIDRLKEF